MQTFLSESESQTRSFARELAKKLKPGDIIAFYGGLGMGKTTFVRGLASAFGYEDEVSSPTFSLVHEYGENLKIYHFDMYRVQSEDDLYSTGFFDYLASDAILLVEWSEHIESSLPKEQIKISFRYLDENRREITVTGDERFC